MNLRDRSVASLRWIKALPLGGEVTAIYPVGGATGQLLRRIVEKEGIHGLTFEVLDETRLSFTVLENETGDEYRFVLPGPSLSEPEWQQCIQELRHLSDRPGILVMSGSLPPGVPDDFYARVARMAKDWGTKLVLDSSGPALSAAVQEGMYLIKPNLRELRELTGQALEDEKSWLAACRALVDAGRAKVVVLTLGDQGALLVTHDAVLRALALPIEPASTVGAGDSFLGAMVWALASGQDLADAFQYGIAAGSAALITPGTELCSREDVGRLYSQVTIHSI
ncbi:1-phosphofructokinase family hexose kinase [Bradyrhizobium sp.]|uniref:1-phosphofructokinase family hexose kinase n=1 Tax=Bradyrhizobium sp. TaxID=376 RepID=UPI002732C8C0|nr:1-phosphofructokinase family hexose kinase [Bradyrhizobium sp.]MDP3074923.1 1-phosphofructokinase family hexose kinase [Bradyrhizobium sp.]